VVYHSSVGFSASANSHTTYARVYFLERVAEAPTESSLKYGSNAAVQLLEPAETFLHRSFCWWHILRDGAILPESPNAAPKQMRY